MTERLNLYVGAEVHKDLRRLAVEKDTTINAVALEALKEYLERNKQDKKGDK